MTTTTFDSVSEHLRTDFDPFDAGLATPVDQFQDAVAGLSSKGPVHFSSKHGGFWVICGYPEIQRVMRDAETFSSWPNVILQDNPMGRLLPLELDPPEHTAYRQALQPLFSPARMKKLEPEICDIVNQLIDGFAARGEVEFVSEFAHELPMRVFLALMDWPLADAPFFTEMTDTTLVGKPGASEEESNAARMDARRQVTEYFTAMAHSRRGGSADSDDITTVLVNQKLDLPGGVRAFNDEELAGLFHLLAIAGLHTTQGSLAWGMGYLSDRPEQRQKLIENPESIPNAVEEILRIEAAVSAGRRVMKDVELGGVQIRKGDQVLCVLAGGNRDDREFDKPLELELDRSPNRHLSFGAGPHRCIGSHLARVELAIAFGELHRRIPDYRRKDGDPMISHASQTRGVLRLPLLFTPEARSE